MFNINHYWNEKIKSGIYSCSIGLGILGILLGFYYSFICFGVTPIMFPVAVNYLINWILWDPKLVIFRLQDLGLSILALLYSASQRDWQGIKQLLKTQITVGVITEGLKRLVGRMRPNGLGNKSFPSGHASAAFAGAAFIHQRYGLRKAIPAYFVASMIGCVRIYKQAHYPTDVIAGAGLGILTAYNLVRSKNAEDSMLQNQNRTQVQTTNPIHRP